MIVKIVELGQVFGGFCFFSVVFVLLYSQVSNSISNNKNINKSKIKGKKMLFICEYCSYFFLKFMFRIFYQFEKNLFCLCKVMV